MKTTRNIFAHALLTLVAVLFILIVPSVKSQAATKNITASYYKSSAPSCIVGTNYIKSGNDYYIKFKAPATATYTIKVSKLVSMPRTSDDMELANFYMYDKNGYFLSNTKKIKTNDGYCDHGDLATQQWYNKYKYTYPEDLASRYFKIAFKKGETVWMKMWTTHDGNFTYTVNISGPSGTTTGYVYTSIMFKQFVIDVKLYYTKTNGKQRIDTSKEHTCTSPSKGIKNLAGTTYVYAKAQTTNNQVVFSLKKGAKFYPQKFKLGKTYSYLYVKNSSGKKGWVVFKTSNLGIDMGF